MTYPPYDPTEDDYEPPKTDWNEVLTGFSQGGVAGSILGIILGIILFV